MFLCGFNCFNLFLPKNKVLKVLKIDRLGLLSPGLLSPLLSKHNASLRIIKSKRLFLRGRWGLSLSRKCPKNKYYRRLISQGNYKETFRAQVSWESFVDAWVAGILSRRLWHAGQGGWQMSQPNKDREILTQKLHV